MTVAGTSTSTATAASSASQPAPTAAEVGVSWLQQPAIERQLRLKTIIPRRPRYAVITHTVERGASVFAIAKEYSIKADTLLWANYDVLNDTPDSLRVGQELNIPPNNVILDRWKDGDTLASIAEQYKAKQ